MHFLFHLLKEWCFMPKSRLFTKILKCSFLGWKLKASAQRKPLFGKQTDKLSRTKICPD